MTDDTKPVTSYVNQAYESADSLSIETMATDSVGDGLLYEITVTSGSNVARLQFSAAQMNALHMIIEATLQEAEATGDAWLLAHVSEGKPVEVTNASWVEGETK